MIARTRSILFAWLILLLALLFTHGPAFGAPNAATEQTIRHLIDYVAGADLTFVRNASEYTPAEAAKHMQKKYRHFRDDIDTAEDFIRLCATKSLMSGKPYLVIDREGNAIPTGDWLKAELAAQRVRKP